MTDRPAIVPLKSKDVLEAQACDWLARLDRGSLTAQERAAFADWLHSDPSNLATIREIAEMWYGIDVERLFEVRSEHHGSVARPRSFLRPLLTRWKGVAAAMATVFLLFAATLTVFNSARRPEIATAYYETQIGEARTFILPDRSTIHLNTNSVAEVDYSRGERAVQLLRGEAVFDVHKEPERPFIVYAANGVVRAVGTRFSVRVTSQDVMVAVTEGLVELSKRSAPALKELETAESVGPRAGEPPVLLSQGEASNLANAPLGEKRVMSEDELSRRLSWTRGELAFHEETLGFVVGEVSRYTPVEIMISDEDLKMLEVTGIFTIGDIDVMLVGLEASLGVKIERISDDLIRISRS